MEHRRRVRRTETVLWHIRHTRVMSQKQMATCLGVGQQTYSKYESGVLVPDALTQERIATVLGVERSLLWGENNKPATMREAKRGAVEASEARA